MCCDCWDLIENLLSRDVGFRKRIRRILQEFKRRKVYFDEGDDYFRIIGISKDSDIKF